MEDLFDEINRTQGNVEIYKVIWNYLGGNT